MSLEECDAHTSKMKPSEENNSTNRMSNVPLSTVINNNTCTHGNTVELFLSLENKSGRSQPKKTCNCNYSKPIPCYHQETHWAAAIQVLNDNGTPWPLHVDHVANLNNLHLGAYHGLRLIQRHRTQPRQKMEHCLGKALMPSLCQYGHAWPAMAANPKGCSPHSWQTNMIWWPLLCHHYAIVLPSIYPYHTIIPSYTMSQRSFVIITSVISPLLVLYHHYWHHSFTIIAMTIP